MLKKHAQFFKSLFIISDLLILSLAWVLSYLLRFHVSPIKPPTLGIPPFSLYIEFLLPLWLIWGFVSSKINLYHPRRTEPFIKEISDLLKVQTLTLVLLVTLIYLLRRFEFSRLTFAYFWMMGLFGLISTRFVARKTLKRFRRKGYNQRFGLIAGTGELGREILDRIENHPELGIQIVGFLTRRGEDLGKMIKGIPTLGIYDDLEQILEGNRIDILFVALPIPEYHQLGTLLSKVQHYSLDVKVLPGAYEFLGLRGGVDALDGLPIISLQASPLYGWNAIMKRILDLTLGTLILVLLSPLLAAVAILARLTSRGPVLYRQERVGMDGRSFQMLKFRTMRLDAEKESGPVWAKENDPRTTVSGRILRRTSLDELPQLFNVLKGEMSLVGPRPERPVFVKEFRKRIPSYMLRHKIKSGMTGWAQVNGWRGNTSLEKRIEHDLYYIQHWSIGFDLRILLMTLWRGFSSKSAY